MTQLHRNYSCRFAFAGLLFVAMSCFSSAPCHAQVPKPVRWAIHEFLGIGGYWFTDSSARNALGSPKFGGTTELFVKKAHRSGLEIDGGVDLFSAGDHWLFGSGHNSLDLYGIAGRIMKPRENNRIAPYLTAGLYVGHIKSDKLGFRETKWVIPSANLGVEYKFARYFTIKAGYRVQGNIHNVNTDGFNVSLKFF